MTITLKHKRPPNLHIDWDINYNCNYRCSYCVTYETGWNDTSFERAIIAIDNLYSSVLKDSSLPVTIWFSGGEPALLPWLGDFCLYIKGLNPDIRLCMTTNGSQPEDYYSSLLKDRLFDFITFSLHFEFAKPSHFLKKIYSLTDRHGKDTLSVIVMYESQALQEAEDIMASLKEKGIKVATHLIRNETYKNSKKTEDFVTKKFDSNLKDVEINGIHINSNQLLDYMYVNKSSFKDWKCWAGVEHYYITKDFNLLAASCGIKTYGNLLSDSFTTINKSPVLCDGRSCICTANLKIRKEKSLDTIS
jgi:MoaA/NifB/PqqE/SkfB family radical SAM enzyme